MPPSSTSSQHHLRLAAALAGGVLLGAGSRKRGRGGRALARAAGLALIGFAARPAIEHRVRSAGERRRRLGFHSTIDIGRPVEEVFAFFKDFENYPRVIGALRTVVDYGDGRSHWEVHTPWGALMSWDAVTTKYVPNSVIAWQSVPGSPIESSALLRFTPLTGGATHLEITVAYHPLRTDLSDAVRALVAPRPAANVRSDLEHARFYLESLPRGAG